MDKYRLPKHSVWWSKDKALANLFLLDSSCLLGVKNRHQYYIKRGAIQSAKKKKEEKRRTGRREGEKGKRTTAEDLLQKRKTHKFTTCSSITEVETVPYQSPIHCFKYRSCWSFKRKRRNLASPWHAGAAFP